VLNWDVINNIPSTLNDIPLKLKTNNDDIDRRFKLLSGLFHNIASTIGEFDHNDGEFKSIKFKEDEFMDVMLAIQCTMDRSISINELEYNYKNY